MVSKRGPFFVDLVLVAIILWVLLPTSLGSVANRIGIDHHPISFFIGPALYSFGKHLIPNVDYFTQYGTGIGALFFYFLGDTPFETYKAVVLFTVVGTGVFLVSFYVLARWLLDSRAWGFFLTVTALIMNFYGPRPMRAPSGWPIRYPLLGLFVLCFLIHCRTASGPLKHATCLLLAVIAGLSLFWCTEIGTYMILVGSFCLWFAGQNRSHALLTATEFIIASIAVFIGIAVIVFGPGVLSSAFLAGMWRPATLYGAGFGAVTANWLSPPEFLFNILAPICLVATVIWTISSSNIHGERSTGWEKQHILLMVALLGLLQLVKYWNMALAAVWLSNAYFPLLILAFWLRAGINEVAGSSASDCSVQVFARRGLPLIPLGIAVLYLIAFDDPRYPFRYGISMYKRYPSGVVSFIGRLDSHQTVQPEEPFRDVGIADSDVALIDERVPAGDRAYVYSTRDWAYLLRAKRAPGFPFIPSTVTPLKEQGERWPPLANAKYLFVDFGKHIWGDMPGENNDELAAFLDRAIEEDFVLDGVGKDLKAYRRVNTSGKTALPDKGL
jgi:hypothetical protein